VIGSTLALLLTLSGAPEIASADDIVIPPPPPPPEASPDDPEPPPEGAAEEPPEPAPPLPPPPPRPSHRQIAGGEDSWIDVGHAFVEQRIFAPVLRVDRFFSDERDLEADRARSFLRWRNQLRYAQGASSPGYTTSLSANLRFPGLNKQLRRLRIEIASQTRDAVTALFPGEDPAPGDVPAPQENLGTADAGLRLRIWETLTNSADLGGGVLFRLPPGVYGRLRFRFVEPLGMRFLARQALTTFWRTDTGFGVTGSAEVERPIARSSLWRLSGSSTASEVSRGIEWSSDFSVLATFESRLGAQVGAGMTGATGGLANVDAYRLYTRVRRDFYRRWIFLELEPEYAWPWTPERGRHGVWGVALRLEVQFQGNEAPPPQPPPSPEPADPPPEGGGTGAG
jgi:hypothetical protein